MSESKAELYGVAMLVDCKLYDHQDLLKVCDIQRRDETEVSKQVKYLHYRLNDGLQRVVSEHPTHPHILNRSKAVSNIYKVSTSRS